MLKVVSEVPMETLEEQIRNVTLLHQRDGEVVYPYADADIDLANVDYHRVRPTTLYVLRSHLEFQGRLSRDLQKQGYHPLNLPGGLVLEDDEAETGEAMGLIPPLVEETVTDGMHLVDGAHRTYLGKQIGRTFFKALHVRGVREDCPVYAHPNDWDEIVQYDEVPSDPALKKRYRIENYASLYRDFSGLNGSRLRS